MIKKIHVLNTASGQVREMSASVLDVPILNEHLVEVPAGTKSFESSKFKPMTAAEYKEAHSKPKASKPAETDRASDSKI